MGGGRKGKKSKKSKKKSYTKAQKMAKARIAAKKTAPKTTKTKSTPASTGRAPSKAPTKAQQMAKARIASGKTISQVKAANKKSMQDAARKRNETFQANKKLKAQGGTSAQVAKDNKQYGNTVPAGSFGISEAGKKQAAANRAEVAAKRTAPKGAFNISDDGRKQAAANKAAAAAKAQAEAKSAAESRRLAAENARRIAAERAAAKAEADRVAAAKKAAEKAAAERKRQAEIARKAEEKRQRQFDPRRLDPAATLKVNPLTDNNYFNLGRNVRIPNEDTASFRKLFKDDLSQVTRTDKAFKEGATGVKGFRPLKAFTDPNMRATGPTPMVRQTVERFLPAGLRNISLGSQIFNQGREDSGLTQALNRVGNTNIGGLSIGFKSPESTDIGARASKFLSGAFDKVAGGLNIGGSAQASEGETSNTGRTLTNRALGAVDAVIGTDLDKRGGRTTPFGERLTESIGAFGTLNQNISDLSGQSTGPINTAKNLAKSLAVGGKNLSMEDMAASTSFAKAFKDKPLDAVANLNPDGSRRVIKTLKTLDKNKDVSEALANYGGEGFQKGLRDTASLVSDNYDKLSTDAKSNRKVVSDMLTGNDPRSEFGKRLAFQQRENPQLSIQSKIKYASDPNFKQYTGTDRQGNKVFENKIKGINRKEMGIIGGLGNFVLSNQGRDVVTGNLPGTNNALDLASNIINTGRDPSSSTYKASQGFLKTIGAGGQPTPGSIIRGVNPFRGSNRGGGSTTTTTPQFQSVGGGGGTFLGPKLVYTPDTGTVPQFQVPELPVQEGTDAGNLANIQKESYQNTFRNLMAINPNYSARFQMRRRRGGRRGSFRRSFSRRFFN